MKIINYGTADLTFPVDLPEYNKIIHFSNVFNEKKITVSCLV